MNDPVNAASAAQALNKPPPMDPAMRFQKLKAATVDFEALLLEQMFQSMESTLQSGGMVGSGLSGSVYSGIMTEAVAKSMAEKQGIGFSDRLLRELVQRDPKLQKVMEEEEKKGASPALETPPSADKLIMDSHGITPNGLTPNGLILKELLSK